MQGQLVRTIKGQWITRPPARCPNGHPLGPNQVLVGHQACLGHGGGHTTWTSRHATRRCTGRCSTPQHCGCCDFTASPPFGGSRGGRNYSRRLQKRGPYEIWDSKLSSFIQTGGPYANRAAGQGCDRPRSVSHRKMMTMRLPYLRRNRACVRHGGIDCSCCANWGWLVLGCGCGWGVHSGGSSRPRVAGVGARAAVPYVAA
jgi:hypothetical protein